MVKPHPLRVERELRGWSQARVAEAVGASTRAVIRWEQRLAFPYPYYREQLCLLFGKSARELDLFPHAEEEEAIQQEERTVVSLPPTPIASGQRLVLADPAIPVTLGQAMGLIGRADILAQVKERLLAGRTLALTALNGLPGVGKTALAVALSTDDVVQQHFADGILWAGLGPQPNRLSLLARWGRLLGIQPADVEDATRWETWSSTLRSVIGSRRLLLVIDDVWSVEDALALQVGGMHCVHLLTTRLPQVAFAFAQQDTFTVAELPEADGLTLLERFVPQVVLQEPEQALALVRAVSGLPLALTLMGKYLASQSFADQPRRLHAALAHLHNTEQRLHLGVPTALVERPPHLAEGVSLSLQAAIAVSDQHLSQQAHAALCALAVFPAKPNSFAEEAALAISQQDVERLDELWDAGLLESSGPGRYTLHQTISDYARIQGEDVAGAQERLVHYILSYVQAHEQDYEALELETSNILAALDTASMLGMQHALIQGVLALVAFLRVRGLYSQAEHSLQQAWQAAMVLEDQAAQVSILRHQAAFAELRGNYALAETAARQGLTLARQMNQCGEVSALLTTLGDVARQHGEYTQARACYEEGLALARSLDKSKLICTLLGSLGWVCWSQGMYSQAEAFCQEGLALARQEGLSELVVMLLTILGFVAVNLSKFMLAEQYEQEGLALARQLGHREHQSYILNTLGAAACLQGKYGQAEAYYQEALALARQIGHRARICLILSNLGGLAIMQGNYAQAERYLQEGLGLARQLGVHADLPFLLLNLGEAIGRQGDYSQANAYLQESADLARRQGALWDLGTALATWGEIHLKYEQVEAASSAFDEVLELNSRTEQDPQLIAWAHYGQARILALRGDITEARRLGQESLAIFEALNSYQVDEVRQWLDTLPQEEVQ